MIVWTESIVVAMRFTPILEQCIIALVESPHVMSALLHGVLEAQLLQPISASFNSSFGSRGSWASWNWIASSM